MMNPEADAPGTGEEALRTTRSGGQGRTGRPEDGPASSPSPWMDKFTSPSAEALLAALGDGREPVERVRSLLQSDAAVSESVSWEGVAWRWSLVYTRPGDETRAWAYVIPDPAAPRLCIPLPEGAVGDVRLKRLKKGVRDAMLQGQAIADVRWVTVGLAGSGAAIAGLEEIEELLRAKRQWMQEPNGAREGSA